MSKQKKKKMILAVLVLVLVIEIIFLVKRMNQDRIIQGKLTEARTQQEAIDVSMKAIGTYSLEVLATDGTVNDTMEETKQQINQSNEIIKKIPNSSNHMNKKKQELVEQNERYLKELKTTIIIESVSKQLTTLYTATPFTKNDVSESLAIKEPVKGETLETLTKEIKALPESTQQKSLGSVLTTAEKQTTTITQIETALADYLKEGQVIETPSQEEISKLSDMTNSVANPDIKESLKMQVALLQHNIDKQVFDQQNEGKKLVALTFDDGPNSTSTPRVLDILAKYQIKATFFMLGNMVETNQSVVKRISDEGHEIGNHSYSHADLSKMDAVGIKKEVDTTNDLIESITGTKPTLLRPPYGAYNDTVTNTTNMTIALWDVDTLDWKSKNANAILGEVKKQNHPNSIILMHDIHDFSADSLESVITYLLSEGYTFCLASELIPASGQVGR